MSGEEMDWEAVAAHLARHGIALLPGERPRFPGGFANRNYRVTLETGPAVLRRPPPGPLPAGAHDMGREHRILSRLPDALAFVPRSLHLCEDERVIGVKFQLIEYRAGVVLGGARLPEAYAGRGAALGAALGETMLSTLAALHAVDPEAVGLGGLGRPEGFLSRAVEGWLKRGAAVVEGAVEAGAVKAGAVLDELAGWLRRHLPAERAASLLHNDFKLDNMILDPSTLEARAVVDWDQGTRGDPLFDLGTLLSYWAEPGDPPAMLAMEQMPTASAGFIGRAAAAARWSALTGRDISDIRFHRVLGMLKTAVIFLQLHALYRRGGTRDPRYARFGALGDGLLAFAHEISAGRYF